MSLAAKPWEVDAQERSRRAKRLLVQAALWAPSMAERDIIPKAIAELPDLARRCPQVGRCRGLPRSRQCGAPKQDRWRRRRSGELRTQSCECFKEQTTFHFTSFPCHHLTTLLHAPNYSNFLTPSQCNFLQTRVACFFRWASPEHFRVHAAYRAWSRLRAEMSREDGPAPTPSQWHHPLDAVVKAYRSSSVHRSTCVGQRSSEDRGLGQPALPASNPSRRMPQQRRVGAVRSAVRCAGQCSNED